jgi:hypothetical protein
MNEDDKRLLLIKVASKIENFDEWFELNDFEILLKKEGFKITTTDCSGLRDYLLTFPDLFKMKLDLESKKPHYFVTFIGEPIIEESEIFSISQQSEESSKRYDSKAVLSSIADNWKLEAKLESKLNYFYHLQEVKSILSKSKYYVIGRKGSGKSSISEYIYGLKDYNTFTEKLSFKISLLMLYMVMIIKDIHLQINILLFGNILFIQLWQN